MDPHIYPDPQTAPLSVQAGHDSGLKTIEENAAVDPLNLNTMWIRIAKVGSGCAAPGGANPIIKLQAGTGDEEPVALGSTVSIWNQPGDTGTEVANAIMSAEANGMYLVKVYLFATGSAWQMRIENPDAVDRSFTWVVASTDALSRQPWIDIPTTLTYDVLNGQSAPLTLQVANKGTGPLTINDAAGTALGSGFTLTAVPAAIQPNSCGNLTITFVGPSAVGVSNATYTVASDDTTAQFAAGHNKRVSLTATTRKLEVALVLDSSGSMSWKPNGDSAPSPFDARWSKLQTAVGEFLDLLKAFGSGMGRFGVAVFPNVTVSPIPPSSAGDVQTVMDITDGNVDSAKNALSTLNPGDSTPMGDGIAQGMGLNNLSFGYFLSDSNSKQYNRRWMVLMSDGDHNYPPPNPWEFFGTGTGRSFRDKMVKAITVAYGEPGAAGVNHTLLNDIAADSNGVALDAGADDAGLDLCKAFRTAITAGLSLDPTTDPGGTLTAANPEARYPVIVTPYDRKVAFVVNWGTASAQRVHVQLITPNCELITPSVAQADPNIDYDNGSRYRIYTVKYEYLRNAADPSKARYGTWKLIISASGLSGGDREPYEFEIITESRLKLALSTSHVRYYAGDPIELSAKLTLDGVPIQNAAVTLHVDAPGQSVANWLAGNLVTAMEMEDAKKAIASSDVTALTVKAFALKQKGMVFEKVTRPDTIAMTYDAANGAYKTTISNTTTPETYNFYVTAIGQTADGVTFRREQRLQVRVEVRPDLEYTLVDTFYQWVGEVYTANVRMVPRDSFGNVVLIDPAVNPSIVLTAKGGEFTGPLIGNLDGSYTRSLRFAPGVTPTVGLEVAGQTIIKDRPLSPIERLRYVDKVVDFRLGGEAMKGANQHTDPRAALGDVTKRERGMFVSLGASGTLAVGIEGQFILPGGDDDVTVFVNPDEDLRPYIVEALPLGTQTWVKLGESAGVTQSFSLGKARVVAAAAIRVTDKSGRARGRNLKPSATPGVSIIGVGIQRAGELREGCWQRLKRMVGWPFSPKLVVRG